MINFSQKLRSYLHDPIDKCFKISGHEERATRYARILGVSGLEESVGPDRIASAMERSLLPKGKILQSLSEVRHPLSGSFLRVSLPAEKVFEDVRKVMEMVGERISGKGDREKFLYLWRNLYDELAMVLEDDYKKFLSLLPADTRIPDHSIWEHLKIVSALNAFETFQNNSLFLFSIGPVQSFISQARKAHDLFMGSFLLSYLAFTGMTVIIDEYGPTNVIYPDLQGQPLMDWYLESRKGNLKIEILSSLAGFVSQPTIPNRFVAIVPESEAESISRLAEKIKKSVDSEWKAIVQCIAREFEFSFSERTFDNIFRWFPESYWVAVPLRKADGRDVEIEDLRDFVEASVIENWKRLWNFAKEKGEHLPNIGVIYQLIYNVLEKSFGARKNMRGFKQVSEEGGKCHLCGEREAQVVGVKSDEEARVLKQKGQKLLKQGKYISKNERLCVICFCKRSLEKYLLRKFPYMQRSFSFPSTSEVATSYFKSRCLESDSTREKFKTYIGKFRQTVGENYRYAEVVPLPKLSKLFDISENIDGEFFIKENLTPKMFQEQFGIDIDREKLEHLLRSLEDLTKDVNLNDSDKYYALILFDGDNLGRWLSGNMLPDIENAYNSEVWDSIPEEFREELKRIVGELNDGRKFLTPAIHSAISHALRNYSIEFVRRIVEEEHLGKLVYAGGDDVLAFVNPRDLLKVMRKLRAAFSGHIKFEDGKVVVDWSNDSGFVVKNGKYLLTMGKNATASCGVVVAHHKMPLKMVLDKVREIETRAKSVDGKDAFAVSLTKHSGESRMVVSKWRYGDLDVLERMEELVRCFSKRKNANSWVSDKFIYQLRRTFQRLKDKDSECIVQEGLIESEMRRAIGRSVHGGEKEDRVELCKEVFEGLIDIFWKLPERRLDNLLSLVEISAFIRRGVE